jgi:putative transposase
VKSDTQSMFGARAWKWQLTRSNGQAAALSDVVVLTTLPRASRTAHASFVLDALEQALHERRPVRRGGLVHHSDRGSQYVSIRYTERLAEAGVEPSVGSFGDSYGNALAETINGLYKAEVIHRRGPWRNFEAVEFATLEWVDWFNHRRLLEPIGSIPPAEAEERYYAMLDEQKLAA